MPDSFGPRTWLVGQILPELLRQKIAGSPCPHEDAVREAIRLADLALDTMGNRSPNKTTGPPRAGAIACPSSQS